MAARERHSKELEVAGLMKVAMVFAHTTLAVTPAYALFLTRIAEGAKQHGAVGAGKFIELPIQVTGTLSLFVCACVLWPIFLMQYQDCTIHKDCTIHTLLHHQNHSSREANMGFVGA